MKLFTEYERQFKRKFPGLKYKTVPSNGYMTFHFECLINGTVYSFRLEARNQREKNTQQLSTHLE